ncbi:MAG: hypothetical protein WKF96_06275 [Solirubrobacteraceae bacterium]
MPAVVALALPLPATAQIDPGVNYDSGSPAGKEYAIPIALGRAEGAGTEDQQAAGNTPFGVGVTPPSSGSGAAANGKDGREGKKGGASASGSGSTNGTNGTSAGSSALTPAMRTRLAEAKDVGGTTLWTIGAALLVALAAALLAVALRGRPARPAH